VSRHRFALKTKSKSRRFLAVSVALHVAALALLVRYVVLPSSWNLAQLDLEKSSVERIGFIALPRGDASEPGRSGGDGLPVRAESVELPPLAAPTEVPVGIPPVPEGDAPRGVRGGSGPVIGSGGPTEGILPKFDSPLWARPSPLTTAPRTRAEEFEQGIASRIEALNDSVARNRPTGRAPGDWTIGKGDKKYGIDQHKIYIGSIEIPSAVLALLPLNLQANPQEIERNRALAYQRADIMHQAQRAANEDEFREAVKRIRERRDRERAQEAAKKSPVITP
jgi:hypothetical protein